MHQQYTFCTSRCSGSAATYMEYVKLSSFQLAQSYAYNVCTALCICWACICWACMYQVLISQLLSTTAGKKTFQPTVRLLQTARPATRYRAIAADAWLLSVCRMAWSRMAVSAADGCFGKLQLMMCKPHNMQPASNSVGVAMLYYGHTKTVVCSTVLL